jgi:hypothetical protein
MAIDYRAVLKEMREDEARLESELKIIQTTIPGIELLASRMPEISPAPVWGVPRAAANLDTEWATPKPYVGMGTKEAILAYLRVSPFAVMPAVIAKSLLDGGIQTTSSDFAGMVGTTLTQMKSADLVDRLESGWVIKAKP